MHKKIEHEMETGVCRDMSGFGFRIRSLSSAGRRGE